MGKIFKTFMSFVVMFFLFLCPVLEIRAENLVIEMLDGKPIIIDVAEIKKIYFKGSNVELSYGKFSCNSYLVLKKLPVGFLKVKFQIKPNNLKNQVWFGGFCGPDGRGGLGLFIYNGQLVLTLGDSCERYPKKYIEWRLPSSLIKLKKWNDVEITFIPGSFLSLRINGYEKSTFKNVPKRIVHNEVYIGTDPRHPGKNYNFCGEIRYLSF